MRTIVAGVDGSDASIRALRFAAGLVEDLTEAKLIVAHARHVPGLWGPEHVAEDEFSDVLDRTEQRVRETAQRVLKAHNLAWSFEEREGEPARALCDIAHAADASFLVVGHCHRSIVGELLLGSISNRLAHQSDVPVLLIRAPRSRPRLSRNSLGHRRRFLDSATNLS